MSAKTTVLITGGNRGIGKGLVENYLARNDYVVIAAVRDPSHATSKSLSNLPVGKGSSLVVVTFDSTSETSIQSAIETLKTKHSITTISVVIANAGIVAFHGTALQTPIQAVLEQYTTNTVGVLALFQAVHPLLLPSGATVPKFVTVSTTVGSIGDMENWPMHATAYGMSKAALNWLTKNIHIENPNLIAFPIHPGWVQTDMGNAGAAAHGLAEAPVTIKDSIDGIVDKIDNSTRKDTSGTFVSFDGVKYPW